MILLFSPTNCKLTDQAVLELGEAKLHNLPKDVSGYKSPSLDVLLSGNADTLVRTWNRWYALEQMMFAADIGILFLPLVLYKLALQPTASDATIVGLVWASICFALYLSRRKLLESVHNGPRVAFSLLSGRAAILFVTNRILEERGGHSSWQHWGPYYYTHLARMLNEARHNNTALEEDVRKTLVKLRDAIGKRNKVLGEPLDLQMELIESIQFHVGLE